MFVVLFKYITEKKKVYFFLIFLLRKLKKFTTKKLKPNQNKLKMKKKHSKNKIKKTIFFSSKIIRFIECEYKK